MTTAEAMAAEELGFVAAVCAAPADDTARLVYADWLEENGRPERAEFIRVQVELAAIPNPPAEPPSPPTRPEHHDQLLDFLEWRSRWRTPYYALRRRERELLDGAPEGQELPNRVRWFGGLPWPSHSHHGRFEPLYTRGFVSRLTATAGDWLAHADALFWHPGQTVECPTKGCDGGVVGRPKPGSIGGQWLGRMCDTCDGTGTVPRPCPETAQPLGRVTLTTPVWPGVPSVLLPERITLAGLPHPPTGAVATRVTSLTEYPQLTGDVWEDTKAVLESEWPGVEFVMTFQGEVALAPRRPGDR